MGITSVFAVAAAMVVSAVAVPQAGLAQTCQRTVSIAPQVSAGEGAGKLTFAVYSGGCAAAGEVGYEARAGSALPGADFLLPDGRLRWTAGDGAVVSITVAIRQDGELEADFEDFTVRLVDPGPDVLIARSSAQGRILDDDGPNPHSIIDDSFCSNLLLLLHQRCVCLTEVMPWRPLCSVIELHVSKPQSSPLTVRWSTMDGTARAGIDYVAVVDQTQTVAPGETVAGLPVQLLSRSTGSSPSWFYVRVSVVSAGAVVDAEAMLTIEGS